MFLWSIQHFHVPIIYAVAGEIATIPCQLPSPLEEDEATMILWYRLDMPNPIYTLDVRNVPYEIARHFPSKEMEGRLKFNVNIHPPVLYITPVKVGDEAEYKCRVDLRRARTLILHSRLIIIVPPEDPIVMDEHGQRLRGVIGPYDEGTKLTLICDVDGGDPTPSVTWWRGEVLIDDNFIVTKRGFVRNKLVLEKIDRSDLMDEFSCQASNTNVSKPRETRIRLDINLYPLSVSIAEPKYPLVAGESMDIVCETVGSRPRPLTTWWLDDQKIPPEMLQKTKQRSNVSSSVFRIMPKPHDNGKRLLCRSVNPSLPNITMESEMLLKVHFIPILNISIGNYPNSTDIIEGIDVTLVCRVWANPKMSEVSWMHNDQLIAVNKTQGIINSEFSVTLRNVNRSHSGVYRCLASNTVGQGSSRNLDVLVKFSPVCRHSFPKIYGVAETEAVNTVCDVDSEPKDIIYQWYFYNNLITVLLQNWTSNETSNVLNYSPKAENGYGTLSCWGRNSVGLQMEPCLIKIVPAGAPEPPQSCSVINQTTINITIECEPGYNGSLLQNFHIEIYDSVIKHLEQNLTKTNRPHFIINDLLPGTSYMMVIYSSNFKGRSESVALMVSTLLPAEKRTATEEGTTVLVSTFIILTCLAAFFVIGSIVTILIIRFYKYKHQRRKDSNIQEFTTAPEAMKKDQDDSQDTSGKGPDIIPFTIESEVNKLAEQMLAISSPESSPVYSVRQKYSHTVL